MDMRVGSDANAAAALPAAQPNPVNKTSHAIKAPPGPVEQVASAFGSLLASSPIGKLL